MTDPQPPARYAVGLVQMAMSADPDANVKQAVAKVSEAAAAGARLVCLPELFRSQYFAQREDPALFDFAEPVPGPSTEALGKVARQAGVVVIVPVFERRAAGLYHNSAAVIDADGRVLGIYRKMHIPDDPAYYEKFYFTPGDLGFRAFDTRVGRIGTLVCWDQWYPEGARLTALQGANVLLYPTAIGWHPKEKATHGAQQLDAWRTIQRSHAIANGCYVAAVNRSATSDSPAPTATASSSGVRRFSRIRSARSWPRRPRTARRSCWVRSTSGASRKSGAVGRFCATAGSTLTRGSAAASSTTTRSVAPSHPRRHRGRPRLPHARRVGTASRHVARMAA